MREYGKVYSTFWSSKTTGSLSDDGKMLALYLLTCSHSTIAGVFRLPEGYVSEDLGWTSERVREGFSELLSKGFANRCETTKWVFVRKHLEWNKPENPNQRKSAAKVANGIPDECCWRHEFSEAYGDLLGLNWGATSNRCETVAEPLLNQKQEQKQEKEQKNNSCALPDGERDGVRAMPAELQTRFDRFWDAYPKKRSKGDAEKAWRKLRPSEQLLSRMLTAIATAKTSPDWRRDNGQYIPFPASWLNSAGWDDEMVVSSSGAQSLLLPMGDEAT